MKLIPFENKPVFTEIVLLLIKQNTFPYGQRHYQNQQLVTVNLLFLGNKTANRSQFFLSDLSIHWC